MENLQNMLGLNVQQPHRQRETDRDEQAQRQQTLQDAAKHQPRPPQRQQPRVISLADAPIADPNPNPKDLYAPEAALKKDYDPIKCEWVEETIKIQIERKPFAEGAMRAAYRMKILEGMDVHGMDRYFVLKLSKDPQELTRQYYKDVETQMEARKWAMEYNKKGVPKEVDFIPASVVILTDRPMKPTCTMERFVEGEYVKYNDNWSWCDEKRNTPQAFSHFTWEASGNRLLICDLQGVADCWTDPQIHTVDGKGFGKGNAGLHGVRQFMKQHRCNGICRALKLQSVTGRVKHDCVGTQWGAALKQREQARGKREAHAADERGKGSAGCEPPLPPPALVGVGLAIDGGLADGVLLPLIVVSVKKNSSAAHSGLIQRGDFIVQVDDVPVQGASVAACKQLIRGPPGSHVTVHVMRGIQTHSITLERFDPNVPTVVAGGAGAEKHKAHQRFQEMMKGHTADAKSGAGEGLKRKAPEGGNGCRVEKRIEDNYAPSGAGRMVEARPRRLPEAPPRAHNGADPARGWRGGNIDEVGDPRGNKLKNFNNLVTDLVTNGCNEIHNLVSISNKENININVDRNRFAPEPFARPPAKVSQPQQGNDGGLPGVCSNRPPNLQQGGRGGTERGGERERQFGRMWDKGFLV